VARRRFTVKPSVGTLCRDKLGSLKFVVTAVDDRFVYVVRADTPKKHQTKMRSGIVSFGDFERDWMSL
jgi:hypothetical protein